MPSVLITGAAGHLGIEISKKFADQGWDLILVDRTLDLLESKEISQAIPVNSIVAKYACDFSDISDRNTVLEKIATQHPRLDSLVNNAGYVGSANIDNWITSFESMSMEVWVEVLEVNLNALVHFCQILLPSLRLGKNPSIINISSVYASMAPDWRMYEGTTMGNPAAYGVSKAGVNQFTRWLATVAGPEIRVNSVAPGGISRNQPAVFQNRYNSKTALGRMAKERDVSEVVFFLADSKSSYVTGQNIRVDGGFGLF
jgi:NAD(P)-dependent dehydrogenase (short-subunit alcohol dehydrogenase family)